MELHTRTTPAASGTRKPGPMPADRVCTHPTCITRLSRYNEAETCAEHGGWPRVPIAPHSRENGDAFADLMVAA